MSTGALGKWKSKNLLISCLIVFSIITLGLLSKIAGAIGLVDSFDGPYVDLQDDGVMVKWICNDKPQAVHYDYSAMPLDFKQCGKRYDISAFAPPAQTYQFDGDFNIVAVSDIHGQYEIFRQLLINAGVIDQDDKWVFGNGHLVITGDIFDRGPNVNEALWLVYKLEKEALAAGGQVHFLLGNHEVMVMNGRKKYLNKKYRKTAKLLDTSVKDLYGNDTLIGRWLRTKPAVIKVNGNLFLHGGIAPQVVKSGLSLAQINRVFTASLVKKELKTGRSSAANYLHGKKEGVTWYRGYFKRGVIKVSQIDKILAHFDAKRIIVGHTSQEHILTRHNGRIIAIDSSIKKGKNGEILLIEKNKMFRYKLSGERDLLID